MASVVAVTPAPKSAEWMNLSLRQDSDNGMEHWGAWKAGSPLKGQGQTSDSVGSHSGPTSHPHDP